MKTKIPKLSKIFLIALAILFLATNFIALFSSAFPAKSSAASNGAPIVVSDKTISCAANLSGPVAGLTELQAVTNDPSTATIQALAAGTYFPNEPSAEKDIFAAMSSFAGGQKVLAITFTDIAGSDYGNAKCAGSMVLFRLLTATDKNTFYGIWNSNTSSNTQSNLKMVSGMVNPSIKTLTFGIPTGSYTISINDPSGLLNNPAYFNVGAPSSGGGSASTISFSTCLTAYLGTGALQSNCLDGKLATFIDSADISFDGNMYVAGQWGGNDTMEYALVPSATTDRDLVAMAPVISINTTAGSSTDLGIQGDLTDINQINNNLKKVMGSTGTAQTNDVHFKINGNEVGTVKTSMGGIREIARYYPNSKTPASDVIQLVFTGGAGGNEMSFYGANQYTKTNATTFTLPDGGVQGCGTNHQPRFVLDSAPTAAQEDGTIPVHGTWYLQSNPGAPQPCEETGISVLVLLMKPDTALTTAPGGTLQNGAQTVTCENAPGAFLAWLFCPVINGLAHAVQGIYSGLIQPMLHMSPISTAPTQCNKDFSNAGCDPAHTYAVWQNFRIFGNIFLIIALLAIVFGQSLGGGLIDAYTARKILPKLLVAAIAVNLSIYLVAFAVDVTNVVGGGVASLMQQPFTNANAFTIQLGDGTGAVGLLALVGGGIWAWALGAALAEFLFLFILIPAFFLFLAILVTIMVRQALIIFLVMVAPVAFALYVLPNTEQYFRRWWELLFKTLLVYPIISVVFALGSIMSVIFAGIGKTSSSSNIVGDLMAFIALLVPLFAIPYSFRLAGGLIGKFSEMANNYAKRSTEAIKGNQNDPQSWRNRTRRNLGSRNAQLQMNAVNRGDQLSASLGEKAVGRVAGMFGNPDAKVAKYNKEMAEVSEAMSGTGADAMRYAAAGYSIQNGERRSDGTVNNTGGTEFFNSKGEKISRNLYDRSKRYFGATPNGVGAQLEYATRKAQTPEAISNMRFAFAKNAVEGDWTTDEMQGVWAQATYPHKDKWLSEWFSTPAPVDGVSGKGGVHFADVGEKDVHGNYTDSATKSFDKQLNEGHRTKEAFKWSASRPEDWEVKADRMEKIQQRIDGVRSGAITLATPADVTSYQEDLVRYAKMSEELDAMAQQSVIQVDPSNPDNVTVAGASAATQGVVAAMFKTRKYKSVAAAGPGGTVSRNDRDLVETVITPAVPATATAPAVPSTVRSTTVGTARDVVSDRDPILSHIVVPGRP